MARVSFHEDECKGCGLCISVCPKKILAFSKGKINRKGYPPVECTDQDKCIGCAMCATMCPDVVIKVENKEELSFGRHEVHAVQQYFGGPLAVKSGSRGAHRQACSIRKLTFKFTPSGR